MNGAQFLNILSSNQTFLTNFFADSITLQNYLIQLDRIARLEVNMFNMSNFDTTYMTYNDVYIISAEAASE